MIRFDLHTHTTYCDGNNTPEEMVRAALSQGLSCIGFSGHGYAPYDLDCCMSQKGAVAYRTEIAALQKRYAGRIHILCGVEQDYWSDEDSSAYDYVIGSVHYLEKSKEFFSIDDTPENLRTVAERFGGDWYALTGAYFETVADVVRKTRCHIIGHFDLVSKFNEKAHFFDERHPRYVAAWQSALDVLLKSGVPFEINTGAISRGWRTQAYPNADMIDYIRARGGRFVLSSDSHSDKTLCFGFEAYEYLADCLMTDWTDVV